MGEFRTMLSIHVREHFLLLALFWLLLLIAARTIHYWGCVKQIAAFEDSPSRWEIIQLLMRPAQEEMRSKSFFVTLEKCLTQGLIFNNVIGFVFIAGFLILQWFKSA